MYVEFVNKLINNFFGDDHTIYVIESEMVNSESSKKMFKIIISPGKEYFSKIIGKNGETINTISNLVKIKGYLKNCQINIEVIK